MRVFILTLSIFFISISISSAQSPFKVGEIYSDLIELQKNGEKMQMPLPEGEWEVTAVRDSLSSATSSKLTAVYLANFDGDKLTRAFVFFYPYELRSSGWSVSKFCRRSNLNYKEAPELYNGTQINCWGTSITPLAYVKKNSTAWKSIQYMRKKGIKIPVISPYSRYYRANYSEYLSSSVYFNPDYYGVPAPKNSGSFKTIDYNPLLIDGFPDKKAFMDKVISWSKKWQKLTDLGFEGKLTLEHMKNRPIFSAK